MRIDLHCHTLSTKGEGGNRKVAPEVFAEKIEAANVEIVAITNHNHFDLEQYELLSQAASGMAQVWPGVELDINRWSGEKPWHMLVVAGPADKIIVKKKVDELRAGQSPKDCHWDFEQVWEAFMDSEVIFVSHCGDKEPAITFDEMDRIKEITKDDWRFYFEPRSLMTLGIWSNHGYSMMKGSDVRDWNEYEKSKFASLRLRVDSFEQFYMLAKRDHQVIQTLLSRKGPRFVDAHPHESVCLQIPLYRDINVIFGQKGTGKSEILSSIGASLEADGVKVSTYIGGKKNDLFKRLVEIRDEERHCDAFGRSGCVEEIKSVITWVEKSPTPIAHYLKWKSTIGNNVKKDRFRLSESQRLEPIGKQLYEQDKKDFGLVRDFLARYKSRNIRRFISPASGEKLTALLEELEHAAISSARRRYIESESIEHANRAIGEIKTCIDTKSNTWSKPSDAGFLRFAFSRIELLRDVRTIEQNMKAGEISTSKYLGTLEDKGRLSITLQSRWLCSASKTTEFRVGITLLKRWKRDLESITGSIFSIDLASVVETFAQTHDESRVTDLSDFIGLDKFVTMSGSGKRYEPSDGEKGIIVIEKTLDADAGAYLLDEPELGMGNLYIDSVIRPKLMRLAAEGKTVVIATHNANLAVRTLPYTSVYRQHIQGDEYKTYLGNPFVNRLANIDDPEDKLDWSEKSMATLEGGPEAFYDRQRIYEAGK